MNVRSLRGWLREYLASVEGWSFSEGISPVYDISSILDFGRAFSGLLEAEATIAGAGTTGSIYWEVPDGQVWLYDRTGILAINNGDASGYAFVQQASILCPITAVFSGTSARPCVGAAAFGRPMFAHSGDRIGWNLLNNAAGNITYRAQLLRHIVRSS